MTRYIWLIILAVVALNLVVGRLRAAALVTSGKVSEEELNGFVRGTAILFGSTLLLMQLLAGALGGSDVFCQMRFPPAQPLGWLSWALQTILSGTIVYWLWARDGADLLARLAPAFSRGPVLGRSFSPTTVRYAVTALVILAPLGNIVMQLSGSVAAHACLPG